MDAVGQLQRSAEAVAVGARADAGGALEAVTESDGRAEADLGRDAFDWVLGGFEEVLGQADAGAVEPLQRGDAGLP
jgi:hypothetical protein